MARSGIVNRIPPGSLAPAGLAAVGGARDYSTLDALEEPKATHFAPSVHKAACQGAGPPSAWKSFLHCNYVSPSDVLVFHILILRQHRVRGRYGLPYFQLVIAAA